MEQETVSPVKWLDDPATHEKSYQSLNEVAEVLGNIRLLF